MDTKAAIRICFQPCRKYVRRSDLLLSLVKKQTLGDLVVVWAAFMTYTRIYLGVHYPGDVLVGALVGTVCGWVAYKFSEWLRNWDERRRLPSSG